jgi:hypothetical protein
MLTEAMWTMNSLFFIMTFGLLKDVMLLTVNRPLLLCVTDIMHQHFTLRKSVLVSTPATSDDYEKRSLLIDKSPADNVYFMDFTAQNQLPPVLVDNGNYTDE